MIVFCGEEVPGDRGGPPEACGERLPCTQHPRTLITAHAHYDEATGELTITRNTPSTKLSDRTQSAEVILVRIADTLGVAPSGVEDAIDRTLARTEARDLAIACHLMLRTDIIPPGWVSMDSFSPQARRVYELANAIVESGSAAAPTRTITEMVAKAAHESKYTDLSYLMDVVHRARNQVWRYEITDALEDALRELAKCRAAVPAPSEMAIVEAFVQRVTARPHDPRLDKPMDDELATMRAAAKEATGE